MVCPSSCGVVCKGHAMCHDFSPGSSDVAVGFFSLVVSFVQYLPQLCIHAVMQRRCSGGKTVFLISCPGIIGYSYLKKKEKENIKLYFYLYAAISMK